MTMNFSKFLALNITQCNAIKNVTGDVVVSRASISTNTHTHKGINGFIAMSSLHYPGHKY